MVARCTKKYIIKQFDCHGEAATSGPPWPRWLQAFELYTHSKWLIIPEGKDDNKEQRRGQLLQFAGPDVQDIFFTLGDTGGVKDERL